MEIAILSTGGTIEKTYDETTGALRNVGPVLEHVLDSLRLPDLTWRHLSIMSKDSLDMNDEDRRLILSAVRQSLPTADAILVVHGTDTLSLTGELLERELGDPGKPVILTGAMRPFEFRDTDAWQNLTEALLACRILPPGVYVVMHNQALRFPGPYKDRQRGTFALRESTPNR